MDFSPEALDHEFPSRRHGISFNHAAVAPLPRRGLEAMTGYAKKLSEEGSFGWLEWGRKADELRGLGARLIGAGESVGGAKSISIIPNTTTGLNLVAQGIDWNPGDEVITTASEFPANMTPWLSLENRGVTVRRIPTREGAFTLEDVDRLANSRTRLVAVSLVAFHTGFLAPAQEIGAFCRARGVLFGLDGIQAAGVLPVCVEPWNVDFLAADGHKWMLGPEGCGILFTHPGLRARLTAPPGWLNLSRRMGVFGEGERPAYFEDGRKFEPGALPTAGIYTLAASLGLLLEAGIDVVQGRVKQVLQVLIEGLPSLGFTPVIFGAEPPSGILAARPPAQQPARHFADFLENRGIAVSAREGFVRFSPHFGNDQNEAGKILEILEEARSAST